MRRLLALVAALTLIGCTFGEIWADYGDPVELKPEDLVGVWVSGSSGRAIAFTEDGAFIATDLPRYFVEFALPDSPASYQAGPIDGFGTWAIDGASVELTFERLAGVELRGSIDVDTMRQDGRVFLLFYSAGGGGWVTYGKAPR